MRKSANINSAGTMASLYFLAIFVFGITPPQAVHGKTIVSNYTWGNSHIYANWLPVVDRSSCDVWYHAGHLSEVESYVRQGGEWSSDTETRHPDNDQWWSLYQMSQNSPGAHWSARKPYGIGAPPASYERAPLEYKQSLRALATDYSEPMVMASSNDHGDYERQLARIEVRRIDGGSIAAAASIGCPETATPVGLARFRADCVNGSGTPTEQLSSLLRSLRAEYFPNATDAIVLHLESVNIHYGQEDCGDARYAYDHTLGLDGPELDCDGAAEGTAVFYASTDPDWLPSFVIPTEGQDRVYDEVIRNANLFMQDWAMKRKERYIESWGIERYNKNFGQASGTGNSTPSQQEFQSTGWAKAADVLDSFDDLLKQTLAQNSGSVNRGTQKDLQVGAGMPDNTQGPGASTAALGQSSNGDDDKFEEMLKMMEQATSAQASGKGLSQEDMAKIQQMGAEMADKAGVKKNAFYALGKPGYADGTHGLTDIQLTSHIDNANIYYRMYLNCVSKPEEWDEAECMQTYLAHEKAAKMAIQEIKRLSKR